MIKFLSNKKLLIFSMATTIIMFSIVMFFVNPAIDLNNGSGVLKLQLSFDKEIGIHIVNNWGVDGIKRFQELIFTDYIYAISYSIFFASLIAYLITYKNIQNTNYKLAIYLAFFAGFMDFMENTMELFFLSNMIEYSNILFFIHSMFSSLKWLSLPVIIVVIVLLFSNKSLEPNLKQAKREI